MIAKLKGTVDELKPSSLYLDVNGVVYEIFTPLPLLEEFSEEQILEYCSEHLACFKVPSIIEICKSLPRTSTGKIRKNLLREKDNKNK